MGSEKARAPKAFHRFVERFPELGEAWDRARDAEGAGPLDEKTVRLVKLGIAIGAARSGSVSSGVRKGLAAGLRLEEIEHVVACAASTLGFPAAVAAFGWVCDAVEKAKRRP